MEPSNNLPCFPEGERCILGAMLLAEYAVVRAASGLCSDDFYLEAHRITYNAMIKLSQAGKPVDWLTITKELRESGSLERVGGIEFLTSLSDAVPSAANVDHYIKVVREKGLLRRTVHLCREAIAKARNPTTNLTDLMQELFRGMVGIEGQRQGESKREVKHISQIVSVSFDQTMECKATGKSPGIPTGFKDLDRTTGGLYPEDLFIICGRPGQGKSALAFQLAYNVSKRVPVFVSSLEMGEVQCGLRHLSREARIDLLRLRKGEIDDAEVSRLVEALGAAEDADLYFDFAPAVSPTHLRLKILEAEIKYGIKFGLIVVDYLQLMRLIEKMQSREQEVARISSDLKAIAKDFRIPVVALSQLSRETEKRKDKRPTLADLRESGAIEQDADDVWAIHRESQYDTKADPTLAELIILKQRNGPIGCVNLFWSKETTTFHDWEV